MNSSTIDDTVHGRGTPSLRAAVFGGPRRWRIGLLLVWLAAAALYLAMPPSPDQFNHGYLGWRLLAGDVPYVDVIDMNWPGVMALHAVSVALFGTTLWAWRALDLVLFTLACAALADLLRAVGGPRAARAFAVACLPLYLAFGYWMAGQHDMTAAQFMAMALWCHVRGTARPGWRWPAAAGVLIALAVLNKPTVGTLLLWLPLQGLWLRRPWRGVVGQAVVMGLAFGATVGGAFAAVLARGTPVHDLVEVIFTFNAVSRLEEPLPWADIVSRTGWWPLGLLLLCLPGITGLGAAAWRSAAGSSMALMVLAGLVSYAAQGRGLHYHLAPCVLVALGLLALTLDRGAQGLARPSPRPAGASWLPVALAAAVLIAAGARAVSSYRALPAAIATQDLARHLAVFPENDGLSIGDAWAFARSLRDGPKDDCVLAVGTSSAINFLAARRQPTRFYYFPVISAMVPAMPMAHRWSRLWDAEIGATRCRHVLVASRVWQHDDIPVPRHAAETLKALLAEHYVEIGPLGDRGLLHYQRRSD